MKTWIELACSKQVASRALKYALVVGAILIAINHGDALLAGRLTAGGLTKMLLTMFVPYAVSTASSVSAIRDQRADQEQGVAARGG